MNVGSVSVLTTVCLVSSFVHEKVVGSSSVLTTVSPISNSVYEKLAGSASVLTTVSDTTFVYEKVDAQLLVSNRQRELAPLIKPCANGLVYSIAAASSSVPDKATSRAGRPHDAPGGRKPSR